MVKRYDLTMCYFASGPGVPDMEESEHGDYVEHGDYAALAERCERLEEALRKALEWVPDTASTSARRLLNKQAKVKS